MSEGTPYRVYEFNHEKSDVQANRGWRLLEVHGPLDRSMVGGVLAELATTLARAGISVFAISTFDTDYVLVRDDDLQRAFDALREARYDVS